MEEVKERSGLKLLREDGHFTVISFQSFCVRLEIEETREKRKDAFKIQLHFTDHEKKENGGVLFLIPFSPKWLLQPLNWVMIHPHLVSRFQNVVICFEVLNKALRISVWFCWWDDVRLVQVYKRKFNGLIGVLYPPAYRVKKFFQKERVLSFLFHFSRDVCDAILEFTHNAMYYENYNTNYNNILRRILETLFVHMKGDKEVCISWRQLCTRKFYVTTRRFTREIYLYLCIKRDMVSFIPRG